jgi:hypothetical protein
VRLTANYDFQSVHRHTNAAGAGDVLVPVQQALARFGVAVGF